MSALSLPLVVARLRSAGCVFAEDEARLLLEAAGTPDELTAMLDRRVGGLPLEHVLGWAQFCGLRILVDPPVFVPRLRTTCLVRAATACIRPGAVVVDLCCGSGAVAAALVAAAEGIAVFAVDLDPVAVGCARRNLPGARVYEGDLFEPLPADLQGRVDVLVANAPYVPTAEIALMPPEARDHEPIVALDGGRDGLDIHRRITAAAHRWLAPGGHLLIETSERQSRRTATAFLLAGLTARVVSCADVGGTVVIGAAAGVNAPARPRALGTTARPARSA